MTKGYPDKQGALSKPEKKEKPATEKVALVTGMALAVVSLVAAEALIAWVILAYLLKAKVAYVQVLGAAFLFEYILARLRAKK